MFVRVFSAFAIIVAYLAFQGCSSLESESCERRYKCNMLPADVSANQCTKALEDQFDTLEVGDREDCKTLHEECLDFEGCIAMDICFKKPIFEEYCLEKYQ